MGKYQTDQRQKLIELFKSSGHQPYSASDILKKFDDESISVSAIYRNLKDMEQEGLICKLTQKGRSEAIYYYVNPESCVGIVHLKCEVCETVYHLNRHISNILIAAAKDDFNFSINRSGVFLHGKCELCSQN